MSKQEMVYMKFVTDFPLHLKKIDFYATPCHGTFELFLTCKFLSAQFQCFVHFLLCSNCSIIDGLTVYVLSVSQPLSIKII